MGWARLVPPKIKPGGKRRRADLVTSHRHGGTTQGSFLKSLMLHIESLAYSPPIVEEKV